MNWQCEIDKIIIGTAKGERLEVYYSGGVDSEYIVHRAKCLGVHVTPVICVFNNGINSHDVKYAYNFCKNNNLYPRIISLDIGNFFLEKSNILNNELKVAHPYLVLQYWLACQAESPFMFGGGPPEIIRKGPKVIMRLLGDRFRIVYLLREKFGNCFEMYPQINHSVLNALIKELDYIVWQEHISYSIPSFEYAKYNLYLRYFTFKYRLKYNGFENIKKLYFEKKKEYSNNRSLYQDVIINLKHDGHEKY